MNPRTRRRSAAILGLVAVAAIVALPAFGDGRPSKHLPCSAVPDGERAIASKKLWPNGSTIKIVFMDGELPFLQKVAKAGSQWTKYANLKFDFLSPKHAPAEGDVRISFRFEGYWSYVGTDALRHKNYDNPTMSLQTLQNEPDEEIQRVTLHEFGHMLGLYHEHQNPNGRIEWNREAVYTWYKEKQGWPPALVDQELISPVDMNKVSYATPLDRDSVMCYRVLPEWTTNGVSVDYNRTLSATDKAVIAKLYPRK